MELNYLKTLEKESGGFNYDNSIRNTALIASKPLENKSSLSYTKTGTTICGVVFKVSIHNFKSIMLTIFFRMVSLSLLIQGLLEEPLSVTRTASKSIISPQIFTAVVLELPLIATTLLRESRESLRCTGSTPIPRAEFKWLLEDFHLRLLNIKVT